MTDDRFDELWARAEAESHADRLAAEYPAWRKQRRRNVGVAMAAAVMMAAAVPLLAPQGAPQDFEKVYCDRGDIDNGYWVGLASDLLMES